MDGRSFVEEDFSVECDTVYKGIMFPVAGAALMLYALGVLVLLYWRLRNHREVGGFSATHCCKISESASKSMPIQSFFDIKHLQSRKTKTKNLESQNTLCKLALPTDSAEA